jgi:hypothetical protein
MLSVEGECEAGACVQRTELLRTADGGRTWSPVPLPGGGAVLEAAAQAEAPAAPAATAAVPARGLTLTYSGQGFDACTPNIPLSTMQAWLDSSPYTARNLYIGGSSGANCGPLIASYVQAMAQQQTATRPGWLFIPTWVGPQPPCSNVGRKMSLDPAAAYDEGVTNALLALTAAERLGLTQPGQAGVVIYYDVEAYLNEPGSACVQAAQSFLSGWTAALRARGSQSGVYGLPCDLRDFIFIPNSPDAIWAALWNASVYDPSASVWGLGSCLSDTLWVSGQRLRQYTGGHNETYGGATINIDSNVLAGRVSTVLGDCNPSANQVAFFVFPNYGGRCVVKGVGSYPSVASLSLPNDSISSIKVGAGVTVTVCQHEFNGGTCSALAASVPNLGAFPIGEDSVSSAVVAVPARPLRTYLPGLQFGPALTAGLSNGNFEGGPAGWTTSSTIARPVIASVPPSLPAGATPRSGSWVAWLGDDNQPGADNDLFNVSAAFERVVAIPPATPYLAYWLWIDSAETGCHYDVLTVWAGGDVVDAYALCNAAETGGWSRRLVNLSAYANQALTLRFQVATDGSLASQVFIDDLSFRSGP